MNLKFAKMEKDQLSLHAELELKHWWFRARMKIIKNLLNSIVLPNRNKMIMDIGCGTGGVIANLSEEYQVVGIDPSIDCIEVAKNIHSGLNFIHGEFPQDIPSDNFNASAYLLLDVLEHINDDIGFFSKSLKAMSPGSYIILTVPASPSLWSPHDEAYKHFRRYEKNRFEELWKNLPVEPIFVSYFNTRLFPIIKVLRKISIKRNKSIGVAGTDLKMPFKPINYALEVIFSGESNLLLNHLEGNRKTGYSYGVSLIAILKRNEGSN